MAYSAVSALQHEERSNRSQTDVSTPLWFTWPLPLPSQGAEGVNIETLGALLAVIEHKLAILSEMGTAKNGPGNR